MKSSFDLKKAGILAGLALGLAMLVWLLNPGKPRPVEPLLASSVSEMEALTTDAAVTERGRQVYLRVCSACHGPQGGGRNGPNLIDPYWLQGSSSLQSIYEITRTGVPMKGMPGWEKALPANDVIAAAVFVKTLQGTTPSDAKAPQGEKR